MRLAQRIKYRRLRWRYWRVSGPVARKLLRDTLEALCQRDGLSLDSSADPGKPARNYELAQRLGIGPAWGLKVHDPVAAIEQDLNDMPRP